MAGRTHQLRATPQARSLPTVWLLGSSDYSARLAAEKGLPYVFAHHFSGSGTAEALELYRAGFRASADGPAQPRTFLTVNACVADTQEEAELLALPQLLAMVALRTGAPLGPQVLVEDAEKQVASLPVQHADLLASMRRRWVVGTAVTARAELEALATTYGVDEVMVHPVAGGWTGGDPNAAPGREETLRLLTVRA